MDGLLMRRAQLQPSRSNHATRIRQQSLNPASIFVRKNTDLSPLPSVLKRLQRRILTVCALIADLEENSTVSQMV